MKNMKLAIMVCFCLLAITGKVSAYGVSEFTGVFVNDAFGHDYQIYADGEPDNISCNYTANQIVSPDMMFLAGQAPGTCRPFAWSDTGYIADSRGITEIWFAPYNGELQVDGNCTYESFYQCGALYLPPAFREFAAYGGLIAGVVAGLLLGLALLLATS